MGLFKKKKKPKYVEEILEFEEQAQPDEAGRPKEQNTGKPQGSRQPRKNPAMEYCERQRLWRRPKGNMGQQLII